MDRRTYLRTAVVGGALALAGCSGGTNDDSGTNGGGSTTTEPPATTEAPAETTTEVPAETTAEPMETTAEPTETTTEEPMETTTTERTATPEPTPTPEPPAQVVEVADGGLNFAPESFTVSVGDTVRWVWRSSNHNVVPDEVPSGTDWEGSPGAPDELHDEGFSFEHTFETAGEYSYYCRPHRAAGMVGSFTVEE